MKAQDLKVWLATVPDEAIVEISGRHTAYFNAIHASEIRARIPEQVIEEVLFTMPEPEPDRDASA